MQLKNFLAAAERFIIRFGVYFKYSPCNVLQPEFGPKFKSITAGLKISF